MFIIASLYVLHVHTSSLQDSLVTVTVIDNPVYGITDRMLDTYTHRNKPHSQPAVDAIESTVGERLSKTQQSSNDEEERQTYEPVAVNSPLEDDTGGNGKMASEYEIPQRQGFTKHEEERNEKYSRLNMGEVRYATLEPHIPGRKRTSAKNEKDHQEETYSTLQH